MTSKYRLQGFDAFASERYLIDGEFDSWDEAYAATRERYAEIERTQPSASSGGQSGIQDRLYIISPDGSERYISPARFSATDVDGLGSVRGEQ